MTEQVNQLTKKRPSISDVALEAGVSKAAVSKVIRNAYGVSPAMRERVETAIERLEYRPLHAARVMRGASFTIGFEVPHLGNDFFTQITEGAASKLAGSGYQLIIAPGLGYLSGTKVLVVCQTPSGPTVPAMEAPDSSCTETAPTVACRTRRRRG